MEITRLLDKGAAGERLTAREALYAFRSAPLLDLAHAAHAARSRTAPPGQVTFVIDTNPNYTNICDTDCTFCAFYRKPGDDKEGYTLTVDQIAAKIQPAVDAGASTLLMQGGHNPDLPLSYYIDLIRGLRDRFPGLHLHLFSAPEIRAIAKFCALTVREVLVAFWDAGQRTLPGGGAEILTQRVRRKISPKKGTLEEWLDVMRSAHQIGYRSTATMMFGHVETDEDIIEHLDALRRLQDETGGFLSFIPWSFKKGDTPLSRIVKTDVPPARYLRILAVARLFLDNFPHIQSSWFSEGRKAGQLGLWFGADDFGGTILEENVLRSAKFVNTTSVEEVKTLIREAGFMPARRNSFFEVQETFDGASAAGVSAAVAGARR